MDILLPIVLLAGLFLVVGVPWSPPSWLRTLAGTATRRGRGVNAAPAAASIEWDMLTLAFVRRRIDVIAAELERLDRDPAVFAKGFRTIVARSAYEALMADASRLAAVPSLDLNCDFGFELVLEGTPTQRREVLER
jgi:hypothetical protein